MLGSDATSQEARLKPIRSLISGCIVFLVAHLTCAQTTPAKTGAHAQFSGYTAQSSSPERDWEKKFQDGIVSEAALRSCLLECGAKKCVNPFFLYHLNL
jgi:hypothetical protein